MKKIIAVLLAIFMLGTMLTGCGGETSEPQAVVSADVPKGDGVSEKETEAQSVEGIEETVQITVEETVVYDNNNIKITATGLEDGWTGTNLKLLVENNSEQNIALSGMEVIINDVTMSAYMYIDVAAGKKANGTLEIYTDSLKAAGIEEIATINVADAYIFDTDSYETIVEIPFYVVTSLGEGYNQAIDDSGDTLLEEKGIVVKSKVISDEFYGKTVLLYVKNESEKDITIEGTNISVNGFMIDAWLYDNVYAGTVRFCELDLFASSLEENGIEEVEDVTFTINIIDPKSYNTIANSGELQVLVNG